MSLKEAPGTFSVFNSLVVKETRAGKKGGEKNAGRNSKETKVSFNTEAKREAEVLDPISTCRICHEGSSVDPLMSPCNCSGSVGFIHLTCLSTWLQIQNYKSQCELCQSEYRLRVFRKFKTFKQYLRESRLSSVLLTCFLVLTAIFCAVIVFTRLSVSPNGHLSPAKASFIFLAIYLVIIVYILTTVFDKWLAWRNTSATTEIILQPTVQV